MGYTKNAVKGVTWMGVLRIFIRGLTFVRLAVLARLLSPKQFGVFGVASLVLGLLEIFTETGISVFLIQENEKIEKYIDTAWIVSILRGVVISILLIILAYPIASFFSSPESFSLLLLIGITPFLRGFINPYSIKFQKELEFNKEFFYRAFLVATDAVVTIVSAFITRNPVSLVYGMIASALLEVILSFILFRVRPTLSFSSLHFSIIIKRGFWMTIAGIFEYLFQHGDDIVVGKLVGTYALGIYQVGYKISALPITEIVNTVSLVTFPVYSKIAIDTKRLRKAFLKSTFVIFMAIIPFSILLILVPDLVVKIVLGDKWMNAVPVVQVLALFGLVRGLSNSSASLLMAFKKQNIMALFSIASFLVLAVIIIPFTIKFGIIGAALSAFITSVVVFVGVILCVYLILFSKRSLQIKRRKK